jgi:hypothetical protein
MKHKADKANTQDCRSTPTHEASNPTTTERTPETTGWTATTKLSH